MKFFSLKYINMGVIKIVCCLLFLFLYSCSAPNTFTKTSNIKYPQTPEELIKTYSISDPPANYDILGVVVVTHANAEIRTETALKTAFEEGGNGIIVSKPKKAINRNTIKFSVDPKSPGSFHSNEMDENVIQQEFLVIFVKGGS